MKASKNFNLTRLVILEPGSLMLKWLIDEGPLGKQVSLPSRDSSVLNQRQNESLKAYRDRTNRPRVQFFGVVWIVGHSD